MLRRHEFSGCRSTCARPRPEKPAHGELSAPNRLVACPKPEPEAKFAVVTPRRQAVAQICNLSVSVQIVASRDDFAERGHPGRSVSPTRESRELTDVSAVGNRCAQDGRAPFRLRLHRAAPYRRFLIGRASAMSGASPGANALQNGILRYSAARQCRNQSFGVRREAKRHAALAALANIPKAVSRFACHRTPKSSWSATVFADTYRLQICARGQKQAALTVMELLVSVAVMTVIVFG